MIYVDVTAACLLPMQSGIPRTTRGLHRVLLENLPEATRPIFWQPFRAAYTELSPRSRTLLENPFAGDSSSQKTPRDSTLPLLQASFRDLFSWPRHVPLYRRMQPEDSLLLTSLFPDNRLDYLERLITRPGRKIAVFHDAIPLHDTHVASWEKSRHVKALRLLSLMDSVLAVSQAAESDLHFWWQKHGISPAPVHVLPWPVPFTGSRPPFFAPPSDKKRVLYVSRLKQTKNHTTLFAACESLWKKGIDFELHLLGCEDEARESRAISRAMTQMREAGRPVFWRGHVTEEELHLAYQQATFTVFPSLMEGFGLPIIESLWHGRIVICGNEGAVGELAHQGGCVTCDVRDPQSLAAAMQGLLADEASCLALAQQAWARPVRSWEDYWAELEPLLRPP